MRKGYKTELQIEDVYKQRRCDESERLTDRLERYTTYSSMMNSNSVPKLPLY